MGQLIKLQDYISRYEQDIYTYPSRFVRLKKKQWELTKRNWEEEDSDESSSPISLQAEDNWEEEYDKEKTALFKKITGLFKFNQKNLPQDQIPEQEMTKTVDSLQFTVSFTFKPETINELKQQFLDQLYRFQLKWASSTLFEKSYFHSKYFFEENLKFFLQRFPDTFLVLYKPIFILKKAPVEAEVVLLTPTDAWCITFIEEEDSAVFIGSDEHFWRMRVNKGEKKILNPLLTLNRTEGIVRNIFKMHEIELPIHKLVVSRNGYIDYPAAPFDVEFAEARNFDQWFQAMRTLKSPLKHIQLKAAQVLLQYCQTTSTRRLEWEIPNE